MGEIKLVKDTIDTTDIKKLTEWLGTNPILTKGALTREFERVWSKWLGVKNSIYVNSGSSANLAALYALSISGRLKNKKIIVPAVSWATTISPAIQLGYEPIMCEADRDNLGLDIEELKKLVLEHSPSVIILVSVLGVPNHMEEIMDICREHNIILIEDTCEAIGSRYRGKKLGTFGLISTFSFYYGHHISTIEGGMVSTDDDELSDIILSIRAHGWDRDLSKNKQNELRSKYKIDPFRALYIFYYPGFNLRPTDLGAFIGLEQMKKIDYIIQKREENYSIYHKNIKRAEWKLLPPPDTFISNFAYPIITTKIKKLVDKLEKEYIECRPLICGSISEHPFWYERYGKKHFDWATKVHREGLYLPNNHKLEKYELEKIIDVVNEII